MKSKFDIQDIIRAYRKFKSCTYFDSSSLHVRLKLAEYEADLIEKLNKADGNGKDDVMKDFFSEILDIVNSDAPTNEPSYVRMSRTIGVNRCIKKLNDRKPSDNVITNTSDCGKFTVESCNHLADMEIPLHIISVLWVMTVGLKINKTVNDDCYAYRLSLKEHEDDEDDLTDGLQLFAPYFDGYQAWRDNAIRKAQLLLDEKKNATLISLDIKRYFYSVRLNVMKLVNELKEECGLDDRDLRLTRILHDIHSKYFDVLCAYCKFDDGDEIGFRECFPLPIGLLSSGVLCNVYLRNFDCKVHELLNPVYYGRYVDDILLVVSDYKYKRGCDIINDLLVSNKILSAKASKGSKIYSPQVKLELEIQCSKILIEHFDHHESRAALNTFKKNIDKNRSEFRLLPFDNDVDVEFEDEAFSLEYSDSENKIRSVKNFSTNKYGASKYLAHKLFLSTIGRTSTNGSENDYKKSANQVLAYFKCENALNMSSLWEKVASFFVVNNDKSNLVRFYKQVNSAIDEIDGIVDVEDLHDVASLQCDLKKFLNIAVAMPLSMNPGIEIKVKDCHTIKSYATSFRDSYLFRQNLMQIPAICYSSYNNGVSNLLYINFDELSESRSLKDSGNMLRTVINTETAKYISPVFVRFHDFNLLGIILGLDESGKDGEDRNEAFENAMWNLYCEFNYGWRGGLRDKFFSIDRGNNGYCRIDIEDGAKSFNVNKKIGLANLKVNDTDIKNRVIGKPNVSLKRRNDLFEVINDAIKKEVDLLILPELSIPVEWLPLMVKECCRHKFGIIFGLEYSYNVKNPHDSVAYNDTVVMLPVEYNGFSTCLIRRRTKNHYSPGEIEFLRGHHKNVPKVTKASYDLFHWRSCYFSVYNCFELTSISDRSLFKSKVDFIVATELNRDVNYFSNIVESWSRDIHCYIVQVNTSNYGDSRIVAPAKSEMKDLLCIKGGEYPLMIVSTLDIDKLRNFQILGYNLQQKPPYSEQFKPTPAGFDYQEAEHRLKNL
jgi:hypothetical protein